MTRHRTLLSRLTGFVTVLGIGLIALWGYGYRGGCDPSAQDAQEGKNLDLGVGYFLRKDTEGKYRCVFRGVGTLVGWNLVATSKYFFDVVEQTKPTSAANNPYQWHSEWAFAVAESVTGRICADAAWDRNVENRVSPEVVLPKPDSGEVPPGATMIRTEHVGDAQYQVYQPERPHEGLYRVTKIDWPEAESSRIVHVLLEAPVLTQVQPFQVAHGDVKVPASGLRIVGYDGEKPNQFGYSVTVNRDDSMARWSASQIDDLMKKINKQIRMPNLLYAGACAPGYKAGWRQSGPGNRQDLIDADRNGVGVAVPALVSGIPVVGTSVLGAAAGAGLVPGIVGTGLVGGIGGALVGPFALIGALGPVAAVIVVAALITTIVFAVRHALVQKKDFTDVSKGHEKDFTLLTDTVWVGRNANDQRTSEFWNDKCPNCDGHPGFVGAPLLSLDEKSGLNVVYGVAYGDVRDVPIDIGAQDPANWRAHIPSGCRYDGDSGNPSHQNMEYPFVLFENNWSRAANAQCTAESLLYYGDESGKTCPNARTYYKNASDNQGP